MQIICDWARFIYRTEIVTSFVRMVVLVLSALATTIAVSVNIGLWWLVVPRIGQGIINAWELILFVLDSSVIGASTFMLVATWLHKRLFEATEERKELHRLMTVFATLRQMTTFSFAASQTLVVAMVALQFWAIGLSLLLIAFLVIFVINRMGNQNCEQGRSSQKTTVRS